MLTTLNTTFNIYCGEISQRLHIRAALHKIVHTTYGNVFQISTDNNWFYIGCIFLTLTSETTMHTIVIFLLEFTVSKFLWLYQECVSPMLQHKWKFERYRIDTEHDILP